MRSPALAFLGLLSACAAAQPSAHGVTPGHTCLAAGTNRFIGEPRSDKIGEAIKKRSHAAVLRWAPPGVMLTMDFREDRATAYLGPDGKITRITCG